MFGGARAVAGTTTYPHIHRWYQICFQGETYEWIVKGRFPFRLNIYLGKLIRFIWFLSFLNHGIFQPSHFGHEKAAQFHTWGNYIYLCWYWNIGLDLNCISLMHTLNPPLHYHLLYVPQLDECGRRGSFWTTFVAITAAASVILCSKLEAF